MKTLALVCLCFFFAGAASASTPPGFQAPTDGLQVDGKKEQRRPPPKREKKKGEESEEELADTRVRLG